jgi:type VI secretion system VasD/TssJ family lipoprotein
VKKYLEALCLVLLIFVVYSCASQPPVPPKWRYEKEAIRVRLRADALLNLYDGVPHKLHICIYQLGDPNAFDQFSEDEEGLLKLLECGGFDGSVISHKILSVQPGQDATFVVDRAEGAKHVGLVARYYVLRKDSMVRLFDVPVIVEKKGLLSRTKVSKAAPLFIDLGLGPQQIKAVSLPVVLE